MSTRSFAVNQSGNFAVRINSLVFRRFLFAFVNVDLTKGKRKASLFHHNQAASTVGCTPCIKIDHEDPPLVIAAHSKHFADIGIASNAGNLSIVIFPWFGRPSKSEYLPQSFDGGLRRLVSEELAVDSIWLAEHHCSGVCPYADPVHGMKRDFEGDGQADFPPILRGASRLEASLRQAYHCL